MVRKAKKFDPMTLAPLLLIAALLGVIAGCPPIRRVRIEQPTSQWNFELVDHWHVSTNGTLIIETENAK